MFGGMMSGSKDALQMKELEICATLLPFDSTALKRLCVSGAF
jgi:hypothetical protein